MLIRRDGNEWNLHIIPWSISRTVRDVLERRMFRTSGIFERCLISKLLSVKYVIWGFYSAHLNSNTARSMSSRLSSTVSLSISSWDCGKMRTFSKIVSDNWTVRAYIISLCSKINVILTLSPRMERSERSSSTSSSPRGPPTNDPRLDISGLIAKAVCPVHAGVPRNSTK